MQRTYTIPAYPNRAQTFVLNRWLWLSRRLYNKALAKRQRHYARTGEGLTYYGQQAWLSRLRRRCPALAEMPIELQRDPLRRLDRAMRHFFARLKKGQKGGFPRFKGRDRWHSMECLRVASYSIDNKIRIPKLGLVRVRNIYERPGITRCLRVIRRARGWRVQLVVDDGSAVPSPCKPKTTVGVDVGLISFATLSTGQKIPNPRFGEKLAPKLRRAQRSLSRKKRGSKRRYKAKLRVARVHEQIVDARRNFAHQVSRWLVNNYDLIALEKLQIRNMARSRLAKSITDASWGLLGTLIAYKAESAGKQCVQVNPAGTSRDCSSCGQPVPKTLAVRRHKCACGADLDRDHNAALNILARAHKQLGQVVPKVTRRKRPLPSFGFC
jgi:putative transposase